MPDLVHIGHEGLMIMPFGLSKKRKMERRATIVDVAKRHFFANGYRGTTMSAIAAELGGSKSTLWQYFESKDALFLAVVQQAIGTFHDDLGRVFNLPDTPGNILVGFAERYIEKIENPESISLQRLIIGESAHLPEIGRVFYDRAARPTRDLLGAYLARLMAQGHLREDDASMAADALIALCADTAHQRILLNMEQFDPRAVPARARKAVTKFTDLWSR
jgi:TetR/AcrR family transcriptional regulator, mexJK operon transcriptional repressor